MTTGSRGGVSWPRLFLVLALLAVPAEETAAQERGRFMELSPLFPQAAAPRRAERRPRPTARRAAPRKAPRERKRVGPKRAVPVAAPAPSLPADLPKRPDARVLLVVGDFSGAVLARGLVEAYGREPSVRVVDRTRERAGLADEAVDWPALLPALAGEEKPAAVVVMLGFSDRRRLPGSEEERRRGRGWTGYGARAAGLARAAEAVGLPLVWVGLPAIKDGGASLDLLAMNELYRTAAEGAGGSFVDTWDGFVDEAGAFSARGPGIDGLSARLRAGDGVGFTAAGRRKLAFFAEKPLAKLLGLPAGREPDTLEDEAKALPAAGRTAPLPLDGAPLADTGELLGAAGAIPDRSGDGTPLFDAAPVSGRADDFRIGPRSGRP